MWINVGGTHMHTRHGTLADGKQDDSLFARMLSGDWKLETDENDCIFLDRDPRSFLFLLQFLRHGAEHCWSRVYHGHPPTDMTAMARDARFFSCVGMSTDACTCTIDITKTHHTLLECSNDGRECMARIIEAYKPTDIESLTVRLEYTYPRPKLRCIVKTPWYTFIQEAARCAALKEGAALHFIQHMRGIAPNPRIPFLEEYIVLEILVACASHAGAREEMFSLMCTPWWWVRSIAVLVNKLFFTI